jgi:hypothetical protein
MRFQRLALSAALTLVVAACGGTASTSSTSTTTTVAPTTTSPTTTTTTPTTTTTVPPTYAWARLPEDGAALGGPSDYGVRALAAGAPGVVAAGSWTTDNDPDAAFWFSSDGVTFARIPHDEDLFGGSSSQGVNGVAWTGGAFVAVGYDYGIPDEQANAIVWVSPDGTGWSLVPDLAGVFGGPDNQMMTGVVEGGPGLVAVGWDSQGLDTRAAVWTSDDGLTWSRVTDDGAIFDGSQRQSMSGVAFGPGGLVAVGFDESGGDLDAAVWTSQDGLAWTKVPADPEVFGGAGDQRMKAVAAAGPGYVAVGDSLVDGHYDGMLWTSPDGITWTRVDDRTFAGDADETIAAVTAGGPGVVAAGSVYDEATDSQRPLVWTSEDGSTWTLADDADLAGGPDYQGIGALTAFGSGVIAGGVDGPEGGALPAFWAMTRG